MTSAPTTTAPTTPATTIRRSTILDAPADLVWAAVRTPQAFRFVTRGLVDWLPIRHRTEPWQQGGEATGWLLLGDVVPFSKHRIRVDSIDDHERTLRSDESGGVIESWRHDIVVEALDDGRSRYTDVVHIDAGPLDRPAVAPLEHGSGSSAQCPWTPSIPTRSVPTPSVRSTVRDEHRLRRRLVTQRSSPADIDDHLETCVVQRLDDVVGTMPMERECRPRPVRVGSFDHIVVAGLECPPVSDRCC